MGGRPHVSYAAHIHTVRMKYRFSDVYSDKNSLAIIYMCLKMHCLKYVVNFILFYSCGPGVAI